jgi:hypothetical protein
MTTAPFTDISILDHLDFPLTCKAPICLSQHRQRPTHIGVYLACPCPPVPLCTPCADKILMDMAIDILLEKDCASCGTPLFGLMSEWIRIEPLP